LHAHILSAQHDIAPEQAARAWRYGNVLTQPFEPTEVAAWYLSKGPYWGIMLGCPRLARCRRRHGCAHRHEEVAIAIP
jgi:hypothetical protein